MQFKVTNPDGTAVDFEAIKKESWFPWDEGAQPKGFMLKEDGTPVLYESEVEEHVDCPPGRFLIQFEEPPFEPKHVRFFDANEWHIYVYCGPDGEGKHVGNIVKASGKFDCGFCEEWEFSPEELLEIASYIRHTTNKKGNKP